MSNPATILLGGYDAKSCPEKTRKSYAPEYIGIELDSIPPGDLARMEAGIRFETEIGDRWESSIGKKHFHRIEQCDRTDESKARRALATSALMADPGDVIVIWNARLEPQKSTNRTGEPDALVRIGTFSDGRPMWAPVDVKDHRSLEGTRGSQPWDLSELSDPVNSTLRTLSDGVPQKVDGIQLAHYHRMLVHLGYAGTPRGGIIGREGVILWHDLTRELYRHQVLGLTGSLSYYDHEFGNRVMIAKAARRGESLTGPEWKAECTSCQFRTTCHDELRIDLDHITLLPGVTPDRARAHYARGVKTVADLARLDYLTATLVDSGVDVTSAVTQAALLDGATPVSDFCNASDTANFVNSGIKTASDMASLDDRTAGYSGSKVWKLAETIDRARVAKVGKVHLARGVSYVSCERTAIEEDLDIEDSNGYVYLIGVRTTGRKRVGEDVRNRAEYHSFVNWDKSPEGEARVFAEFWEHVKGMRTYAKTNRWGYRLYHYSHHEPSSFKALAIRHNGLPGIPTLDEVIAFFEQKDVIDMYPLMTSQLIWPTESSTLKELAKWVRFTWRDSDPGGGNSMAWYDNAVNHIEETVREENRKRILEYNADDVAAQVALRDWLTRLGEVRQPGKRLPGVDRLDARFRPRRSSRNSVRSVEKVS
jgi:predicted RecB family nuclease